MLYSNRVNNLGTYIKKHTYNGKSVTGNGEYTTALFEYKDFLEISIFISGGFEVIANRTVFTLPDGINIKRSTDMTGFGCTLGGVYFCGSFYCEDNKIKTSHQTTIKFAYYHGICKKN